MDIFEFAIQMERDGRDFYLQLAAQATHTGIQNILTMLADDERKHEEAIRKVRTAGCTMPETAVLDNAKNVFRQMQAFGGRVELSGDEESLYRQAMELENKSIAFYNDKADLVQNPDQRALFMTLVEEEKKHYHLLENMVDFVTAPKTWLADAEFERLDDY